MYAWTLFFLQINDNEGAKTGVTWRGSTQKSVVQFMTSTDLEENDYVLLYEMKIKNQQKLLINVRQSWTFLKFAILKFKLCYLLKQKWLMLNGEHFKLEYNFVLIFLFLLREKYMMQFYVKWDWFLYWLLQLQKNLWFSHIHWIL